jgi:hypothetical protein
MFGFCLLKDDQFSTKKHPSEQGSKKGEVFFQNREAKKGVNIHFWLFNKKILPKTYHLRTKVWRCAILSLFLHSLIH